jgi:hypothetical protein
LYLKERKTDRGGNCITMNFITCILCPKVIKSRRMRWVGHVARMEEGRGVYRVWLGGPKVRDYWKYLGIGGRITLRWTFSRYRSMGQTRFG